MQDASESFARPKVARRRRANAEWTHRFPDHHLEEAQCFRCDRRGETRLTVAPFQLVDCPDCGQSFVSPRLNEEGRAGLYGDSAYFDDGVYGSKFAHTLQRTWIDARLDWIESNHHNGDAGSMLEIGCAYGLFLEGAAERGYSVHGLEFSETAATAASRRLGTPIATGEIDDLVGDNVSDVVAAWDVIEHVSDPRAFLDKAYELIAPGGMLALSCPNAGSLAARVLGRRWWNLKLDRHIWQFTADDLQRLLTEAGYENITLHANPMRRVNFGRIDSLFAAAQRPLN